MKKLVIGILAHVDAGKTTLSEGMLYQSGSIRKMGRVDNQDAFLDTFMLEKARGITIFSKQAVFAYRDTQIQLLDTPGHVDFSAEMERTLQVLDYAVLVISGADGVQGHTQTLWSLLEKYQIPVFLFINKMDQPGTERERLLNELKERLDAGCIEFGQAQQDGTFYEHIALTDEGLLDSFLEKGTIKTEDIKKQIRNRKIFPCFFGSALKLDGVDELLKGIDEYTCELSYPEVFGARVFKIARDEQGNRLTYMKITGGSLRVRAVLSNSQGGTQKNADTDTQEIWEEKVNQIRIYSGARYEAVNSVEAGCICTVTGLGKTCAGQGLGHETVFFSPFLEPVLTYRIELPPECDAGMMLPKLYQLEEEHPELHFVWNDALQEIQAHLMGEVQTEILKELIRERFDVAVGFDSGNIVYKETIRNTVEGVGHFEPLRHYAEVHLLLEPGEPGSGLSYQADCSEDVLDRNWQNLILTHLAEKEHKGVLTGAPVTDMRITLAAGRAHQKHTEGGDFRQATYRAVRQGMMEAESVLLEPYYNFRLDVPEHMIGRAMSDIDRMDGTFEIIQSKEGTAALKGVAPVINMRDYHKEVTSYTKGYGRLSCSLKGYEPCHNQEEVIKQAGYDPERDTENLSSSVFCSHGSGFIVTWEHVKDYMHVECVRKDSDSIAEHQELVKGNGSLTETWIDEEEVEAILNQAHGANKRAKSVPRGANAKKRVISAAPSHPPKKKEPLEEYLLVDGYNIIFAWPELKRIAEINLDGARDRLLDILCNYQGIRNCQLIAVFDAYKVKNHMAEIMQYHNIDVVYTKTAETADQYIEKFAYQNAERYHVTVATSDALEQIIIRGKGCRLLSARELLDEINLASERLQEDFRKKHPEDKTYLLDSVPSEIAGGYTNENKE